MPTGLMRWGVHRTRSRFDSVGLTTSTAQRHQQFAIVRHVDRKQESNRPRRDHRRRISVRRDVRRRSVARARCSRSSDEGTNNHYALLPRGDVERACLPACPPPDLQSCRPDVARRTDRHPGVDCWQRSAMTRAQFLWGLSSGILVLGIAGAFWWGVGLGPFAATSGHQRALPFIVGVQIAGVVVFTLLRPSPPP